MKFLHLSDLHIGKRVNEFSMIEDQKYILKSILGIVDEEKPDGIFIAGDVYDKSVPSAEAVQLLDDFLCSLAERKMPTYIISGSLYEIGSEGKITAKGAARETCSEAV